MIKHGLRGDTEGSLREKMTTPAAAPPRAHRAWILSLLILTLATALVLRLCASG